MVIPISSVAGGLEHPFLSLDASLEFFETPYRHFVIAEAFPGLGTCGDRSRCAGDGG